MALIPNLDYDIQQFKTQITELQTVTTQLSNEIKKRIGTIFYTADSTKYPDALICDGSELNVSDYEELYNVIGYLYGGSDTVFKLPDLINRVPWGAVDTPGYLSAGLPNITGKFGIDGLSYNTGTFTQGCLVSGWSESNPSVKVPNIIANSATKMMLGFDAKKSNNIYGNSNTVQPPACKLTPMIWFR